MVVSAVREFMSDLLATRLVTVLVAKLFDVFTLWLVAKLLDDEALVLLVLLEDSPQDEVLFKEADSAS